MDLNEYQDRAMDTACYPSYAAVLYSLMGLFGEVGELGDKFLNALWPDGEPVPPEHTEFVEALAWAVEAAEKCQVLSKQIRGNTTDLTDEQRAKLCEKITAVVVSDVGDDLIGEVMDCVWFSTALIEDLGGTLEKAATDNLRKLASRKAKGQIHLHRPDSQDHKEDR